MITGRGEEAGTSVVAHPEIRKISFTGSVPTGRAISALAASPCRPPYTRARRQVAEPDLCRR